MIKKSVLFVALLLCGATIANSESSMTFEMENNSPKISSGENIKLEGVRQSDGSVLFVKTNEGEIIDGTDYDAEDHALEDDSSDDSRSGYVSRLNSLYSAVVKEDLQEVKRLILSGSDTNQDLYAGNTALHLAASYGNIEMFNFLLSNKGSLSVVNKNKESPLHYVCSYGNYEMLEMAKEALGSNFLNSLNREGINKRNCLHYATMSSKDLRVIDSLMKSGMNINHVAKDGQTPTLYAINLNNWNSLKIILENNQSVLKVKNQEEASTEEIMMEKMPVLKKLTFFKYFSEENQEKLDSLFYSVNL